MTVAVTEVGHGSATSGTTVVTALTANVAVGDVLIAMATAYVQAAGLFQTIPLASAVADDASNTWKLFAFPSTAQTVVTSALSSGQHVTVTFAASVDVAIVVLYKVTGLGYATTAGLNAFQDSGNVQGGVITTVATDTSVSNAGGNLSSIRGCPERDRVTGLHYGQDGGGAVFGWLNGRFGTKAAVLDNYDLSSVGYTTLSDSASVSVTYGTIRTVTNPSVGSPSGSLGLWMLPFYREIGRVGFNTFINPTLLNNSNSRYVGSGLSDISSLELFVPFPAVPPSDRISRLPLLGAG